MNFVRKALLVLITPLFTFLLFATALDMGVLRIAAHPANIEKMLNDSGLYNTSVNGLLDQAKTITDKGSGGGDVPLNNKIIRTAANQTFSPAFLRTNTETVINSIYAWLDGTTTQPDFRIDLTKAKAQFSTEVAKSVELRAAKLPACTTTNASANFDALSAKCLPRSVTPAAAADKVQANILGGKGFLDHPIINAKSVKGKNSNQSIFSGQLKSAPQQYQRVKKTPIILAITTLAVALVIVFLSATRRQGVHHLGVVLLVIGLFMLIFAWGLNEGFSKHALSKINLSNAVLQKDVRALLSDVEQSIDQNYWIFGGVYAGLGILAIAATMFWGKGTGSKTNADLEGEGRNRADRIDLREPDRAISLTNYGKLSSKPKPKKPTKIQ